MSKDYDKEGLADSLEHRRDALVDFLNGLSDDQYDRHEPGKWSAAQQADHLIKSVLPINIALSLPKIAFLPFGRSGSSRDYDSIRELYQLSLKQGAKAAVPYQPFSLTTSKRPAMARRIYKHYSLLANKVRNWKEDDLDRYRLPHPFLGKLTVREILYFTDYHMLHHLHSMSEQALGV